MPTVGAIGTTPTESTTPQTPRNTINQEDFMRLFLAQLQFQDPLEPGDNREFLAQLAQFSALEQMRTTSENTNYLASTSASQQALSLVGRRVSYESRFGDTAGVVQAIEFTDQGPLLTITSDFGLQRGIPLGAIDGLTLSGASSVP